MLNSHKHAKIGIISGHIDSDGTINKDSDGSASSVSPDLISGLALLVNSLGYFSKTKRKTNLKGYHTDSLPTTEFGYKIRYTRDFLRNCCVALKRKNIKKWTTTKKHYRECEKYFYVSVQEVSSYSYNGPVVN